MLSSSPVVRRDKWQNLNGRTPEPSVVAHRGLSLHRAAIPPTLFGYCISPSLQGRSKARRRSLPCVRWRHSSLRSRHNKKSHCDTELFMDKMKSVAILRTTNMDRALLEGKAVARRRKPEADHFKGHLSLFFDEANTFKRGDNGASWCSSKQEVTFVNH